MNKPTFARPDFWLVLVCLIALGPMIYFGQRQFLTAMFYLVYKLIFWNSFTVGIAPLVIGFFTLLSIQLIGLGILGEYIGSIHTMIQNRPLVIEKERVNFTEPEK